MVDGSCEKQCPIGFFGYLSSCFKCSSVCKECEGRATNCLSCPQSMPWGTSLKYDKSKNYCYETCSDGSFLPDPESKVCEPCKSTCSKCKDTADNCVECRLDPNTNRDLYLTTENTCVDKCPAGYVPELFSHVCTLHPILSEETTQKDGRTAVFIFIACLIFLSGLVLKFAASFQPAVFS